MYLILSGKIPDQLQRQFARSFKESTVRLLGKAAKYETCDLNSDLGTLTKPARSSNGLGFPSINTALTYECRPY